MIVRAIKGFAFCSNTIHPGVADKLESYLITLPAPSFSLRFETPRTLKRVLSDVVQMMAVLGRN